MKITPKKVGIAAGGLGLEFGLGVGSNAAWDKLKTHHDQKKLQENFKKGHSTVKHDL